MRLTFLRRCVSRKYVILIIALGVTSHLLVNNISHSVSPNSKSSIPMVTDSPVRMSNSTLPPQQLLNSLTTNTNFPLWNEPGDNPAYFSPRDTRVTPLDFDIVIKSETTCEVAPFLLILVLTMHEHEEERQTIRSTWGRVAYGKQWPGKNIQEKIKIVFLLAEIENGTLNRKLEKEASEFKDIVLFGFRESYFNLTYKVLMGFKWVKLFCPTAKVVMKVDEDSFVNIPRILDKIRLPNWTNSICGLYFPHDKAYRIGKYRVLKTVYPFVYYPPHVKGNLYILPTSFALRILNVSEHLPYLNMEDVHITGVLALAAGVAKHQSFAQYEFSPWGVIRVCDFNRGKYLVSAFARPQRARDLWVRIERPHLCGST